MNTKNMCINIFGKNIRWQSLLCILLMIVSFATALFILLDFAKPSYYGWLFLLPLTFGLLSAIYNSLYMEVPNNLGISVMLILFFVRMVVSPLLMRFGGYAGTISLNIENNTTGAVFLVVWEAICVFSLLYIVNKRDNKKVHDTRVAESIFEQPKLDYRYTAVLGVVVLALCVCLVVTPELMKGYRTFFHMKDADFTSYEDSYLVAKYGTTFIKKLSLVTGQYLVRILTIVIPAYLMILISADKKLLNRIGALACCILPMFVIGGAIARSLIYTVCLLMLYNYLFNSQRISKRAVVLLCGVGVAVVAYWIMRGGSASLFEQFSKRFSAYFSGVNVVSGVFNLPKDIEAKVGYFLYDFIGSVPYGTTLFGPSQIRISYFFNTYNASSGQIPATIGMGYYYFGPVLAPLYSMLFAYVSYRAGYRLKHSLYRAPISCVRLLLYTFYFSMGIVMYNIEILITNYLSIFLPIHIMELIAYRMRKENKRYDT